MTNRIRQKIPFIVRLSFFVTSYIPLFFIIVFRQILQNKEYFTWDEINKEVIDTFILRFGVSLILCIISIFGLVVMNSFLNNIRVVNRSNGHEIVLDDISNKNVESIVYISTYIIPLVFETYTELIDIIPLALILLLMFLIYSHSNLLVVNPLLSLKYSLYEIEFHNVKSPKIPHKGIIIIDNHYIERGDTVLTKKIQNNMYFGILLEAKNE